MASPQNDIIHLLPDSVANQIAAGEVIQRPASVIKELVENSVDAGATNIEIVVKDAGKTLIQVVDDGKGMSTTDARMAFERHATSKIRCADDLFSLHTMGFRGEALPSVAAVSEIEMLSRRDCDELGTKIVIRASHFENQEPAVTAKGTNIKVKNLFYNFVARRRFLKKDSVELNHIIHEFERLALVNTGVSFKFSSNGVMLYSFPKGPIKERISSLFGKSVADNLIPVSIETSLVSIDGFVSLPQGARQRGQRQFLFVNGRNMRHPYFHKAILSCYENLIPKDCQPHYFLNFRVAPDRIDVNIHPQKHEIKFEDEQSIWHILTASIRETLGRYGAGASIEFNNIGAPDIPPLIEGAEVPDMKQFDADSLPDFNPFDFPGVGGSAASSSNRSSVSHGSEFKTGARPSSMNTYKPDSLKRETHVAGWEKMFSFAGGEARSEDESNFSKPIQLRDKYIAMECSDGLMLIDQHRAHINILYDTLVSETLADCISSQALMFSEPLDLDASEMMMLDSSIEIIERIGFIIGKDAAGRPVLEAIPGTLNAGNPGAVLKSILNEMEESKDEVDSDMMKKLVLTLARASAIKAGQRLTAKEMEHIVSELFRLPSPGYTPDGQTVIYRLTDERLASFF